MDVGICKYIIVFMLNQLINTYPFATQKDTSYIILDTWRYSYAFGQVIRSGLRNHLRQMPMVSSYGLSVNPLTLPYLAVTC